MDRCDVRAVYDEIATHFAQTRQHPWPEVEAFLTDVSGHIGLDIGCGNGRHLEPLGNRVDRVLGLDVSPALLGVAATDHPSVSLLAGDAARLPVATDMIDVALYVATLHHLPERSLRIDSLDELARVLTPDGQALVSVWSTAHDRFDRTAGFDTTVDWTLPGGRTLQRFYHIYDPEEFSADLAASALTVERTRISSGNCYARVRGKK